MIRGERRLLFARARRRQHCLALGERLGLAVRCGVDVVSQLARRRSARNGEDRERAGRDTGVGPARVLYLAPRCRIDPERALEEVVRVAHPAADADGHLFGADAEGLADVHAERGEAAVGPGLAGGRRGRDAAGRALVADHGGVGEGAPTRDGGTDERDAESVHLGDARHPFDVGRAAQDRCATG